MESAEKKDWIVLRSEGASKLSGPEGDKAAGRRLKVGSRLTVADGKRAWHRETEVEESSRSRTGREAQRGFKVPKP